VAKDVAAIINGDVQIIRPGDTLVLLRRTMQSEDELARMVAQVKENMPGVKLAIIDGFVQMNVYRPDDPEAV
jgi:hypothetical protein